MATVLPSSVSELWKGLTNQERRSAAEAFLKTEYESLASVRSSLLKDFSRVKKYTLVYVQDQMDRKALAHQLATNLHVFSLSKYLSHVFRAWLLNDCAGMISDFLKSMGLSNTKGVIEADVPPLTKLQAEKAYAFFKHKEVDRLASFYLVYTYLEGGAFWDAINQSPPWTDFLSEVWKGANQGEEISVESQESANSPENAEDFTLLDRLLIESAVASRMGTLGAFPKEDFAALVEEFASLNQNRLRSVFHRGFLHALFGHDFHFHFAGENDERRQWYFAGVLMGLARAQNFGKCLDLLKEQREIAEGLAANTRISAGRMILNALLPHLWGAKRFSYLNRMISAQLPVFRRPDEVGDVIKRVYKLCADSIRRQDYLGEVTGVLRILRDYLLEVLDSTPDLGKHAFIIQRKLAQAFQGSGQMDKAIPLFEEIIEKGEGFALPDVAVDLALARANIRSLAAIFNVLMVNEKKRSLRDSLESMQDQLQSAIKNSNGLCTNAHLLLGIYYFFDERNDEDVGRMTREHLASALLGMTENADAYETAGVYPWTRLVYCIALLESCDPGLYNLAVSFWEQSQVAGLKAPNYLNERLVRAACLYDDLDLASRVAEQLLGDLSKGSPDWLLALGLKIGPKISAPYLNWVRKAELAPAILWPHLDALLSVCLSEGLLEQAREILDLMERSAEKSIECSHLFLGLLERESAHMPAWDLEDAVEAKIAIWERTARHADILGALSGRFHRYRAKEGDIYFQEARNVFQTMQDYMAEHPDADFPLQDLERSLSDRKALPDPGAAAKRHALRILFIGGNETQERYINPLKKDWSTAWPGLNVDFYMPGWDSSWNHHWNLVRPKILGSAAVVLSPLVRTQFGRAVRANCNEKTPWFSCTGRGRASIKRSVEEAARWILAKNQQT